MTTIHWNAAVNGNFDEAANWSPQTVPGQHDTADLDASGGKYSITSNNSSAGTFVYDLNISSNISLYVLGSKGMEGELVPTNSTVNDGKIVIGTANGESGALFGGVSSATVINNSLIVVKDGNFIVNFDNNGVLQIAGGNAEVTSSSAQNGKYRIDGGRLLWKTRAYLGTVNFNGQKGGLFEVDPYPGFSDKKKIANISGFTEAYVSNAYQPDATAVQIDLWKGSTTLKVASSTKSTQVTLDNRDWINFNGDYTNATFSAFIQNGNLVIVASAKTTSAAALFSQTAATFGVAAAAPLTTATSLHSAAPMLLAANTHALHLSSVGR